MRRSALTLLILVLASAGMYSQKTKETPTKVETQTNTATGRTIKPDTIELISPWVFNGPKTTYSEERRRRSCFDFESLSYNCTRYPSVHYGDRIGINWDLFQVFGGRIDRTRMVEVGKFGWTDRFTVPYVEPWPALAPGETRAISINTSGERGAPGAPGKRGEDGVAGMNGDGTYTPIKRPQVADIPPQPRLTTGKSYATANVKEQVSSTVKGADGKVKSSSYTPEVEAKKGYMYVVHVVDETHDYYVLIHVDDVVRGERVVLSFVKLELFAL